MSTSAEGFRHLYEYEKDSHAKVYGSLAAVPEQLRSRPEFRKAVDLLAHILLARRLWLYRFGAAPIGPAELFPQAVPIEDVAEMLRATESAWSDYLARLTAAEAAREFVYRSLEGDWYRNTTEQILTQLFGHSWYHRGQIAMLVRARGCEPAVTDYVFWTRAPVVAPK